MPWAKIPFMLNFSIFKLCMALNLLFKPLNFSLYNFKFYLNPLNCLLLGGDWERAGPGQFGPWGVGRCPNCLYLSPRPQFSRPGEYDIPPDWDRVKGWVYSFSNLIDLSTGLIKKFLL